MLTVASAIEMTLLYSPALFSALAFIFSIAGLPYLRDFCSMQVVMDVYGDALFMLPGDVLSTVRYLRSLSWMRNALCLRTAT